MYQNLKTNNAMFWEFVSLKAGADWAAGRPGGCPVGRPGLPKKIIVTFFMISQKMKIIIDCWFYVALFIL